MHCAWVPTSWQPAPTAIASPVSVTMNFRLAVSMVTVTRLALPSAASTIITLFCT